METAIKDETRQEDYRCMRRDINCERQAIYCDNVPSKVSFIAGPSHLIHPTGLRILHLTSPGQSV